MRLTSVQIRNFRSIGFLELPLDPSCRVLVGINESGKSNILKALASLGTYVPSKQHDVREPLPNEPPIEQAEIQFRFALDTTETKDLFSLASQLVVARDMEKTAIALRGGQELTLRNFVEERNTGLYDVDVLSQTKKAKYWAIGNKYELAQGWKKPSDACPVDLQVKGRPGSGTTAVKSLKLIYSPDYPELPDEAFAEASIQDLAAIVGINVAAKIEQELPETVSWEYSDQNLLPASIGIDQFASNPNSCLPLKNMFTLAGVEDIGPAIAEARGKSRNFLLNFFQSIAEKTTTHFRSVWKEYKDVAFELHPDGDNLIPGVREQNRYDFERRSDGFKRFVSFLLQISTRVKSGTLSGALLLIDEPDISLHPSGARFLRDELIRISKSNYVVYSTHSIFMIDRENISRHLIVEKEKEQTRASVTTDSNIADEEVIFNALGYSILEGLKKRNLLFEGWKDKHIFEVAIRHPPSKYRKVASHFKEIGRCHAKGVKQIKFITPFMELAQRECVAPPISWTVG